MTDGGNSLLLSIKRAAMLISENMTSFDAVTNLTKPRIANTYEAILFTEDGGYFVVNGHRFEITKGTVRFLKPGQEVYSKRYKDAYVVYFSVDNAKNNVIDNIPARFICRDYNKTVKIYQNIIKNYVNQNGIDNFLMYSCLYELIYCFLLDCKNSPCHVDDIQDAVAIAMDFIDNNYMKSVALCDIAKSVNLHPNYLHRIFKRKTGLTPFEYLSQARIKSACDMLVTTTNSISEISLKCGFDSSSYFISVFKNRVGTTPYKYRKQYSQGALL